MAFVQQDGHRASRFSPETIESLFVAFRLTGDSWYRDQGWAIFQAIEKHCRIPSGGYASVTNVDKLPVQHEDRMETFLMVDISCLSVEGERDVDEISPIGRNFKIPLSSVF